MGFDNIMNSVQHKFFSYIDRSYLKEFTALSASTLLLQTSRFLTLLLIARWLGPEKFGTWNMLNLILIYGSFINFGVLNAMNREVPFYNGRGSFEKSNYISNLSWTFSLFTAMIFCVVSLIVLEFTSLDKDISTPLKLVIMTLFAQQIYNYFQIYFKANIKFNLVNVQRIIFGVFFPLFTIPLTFYFNLYGFIIGQTVTFLSLIAISYKITPIKLTLRWNFKDIKRLIKIGLPIMGAGLLYSILITIDRWIIVNYLSIKDLGFYSITIMTISTVSFIPMILAEQYYPRMAYSYGQMNNRKNLKPIILKQSISSFILTMPVVISIYLFAPPLIKIYMPDYIHGIQPLQIAILGMIFLSLAGGPANFLNTIGKQTYYLIIQGIAIIINIIVGILFIKFGFGLNGVALSVAITYAVYGLILSIVVYAILAKT